MDQVEETDAAGSAGKAITKPEPPTATSAMLAEGAESVSVGTEEAMDTSDTTPAVEKADSSLKKDEELQKLTSDESRSVPLDEVSKVPADEGGEDISEIIKDAAAANQSKTEEKNTSLETKDVAGGGDAGERMEESSPVVDGKEAVEGNSESNVITSEDLLTKPAVVLPSLVVPLVSPRIPSLASAASTATSSGVKAPAGPVAGVVTLRVSDKEMKPTVQPTLLPSGSSVPGDNFKVMAHAIKSISSALAPKLPREKRKHEGGCCNVNCNRVVDELVIASRNAILYFHFNTTFKKVYKICTACQSDADNYAVKATRAAVNGDCILTFKTEPQGMDADVIEISDREVEDDPKDVQQVDAHNNEVLQLADSLDEIISAMLTKIDTKKQVEKCEKAVQQECNFLDRDFISLESKLTMVEKQMAEAKEMYDKITGQNQSVPIILEELDIDAKGCIKKSRGENPHLANLDPKVQENVRGVLQHKTNRGEMLPEPKPDMRETRKASMKENRQTVKQTDRDDDGEIMEVSPLDSQTDGKAVLCPTPQVIPKAVPKIGHIVYAMHKSLLHYWLKGEVVDIIQHGQGRQPDFIVKFEPTRRGKPVRDSRAEGTTQSVKQVSAKQVAYNMPCPFILPVGARILAKFRDELKTEPIGDGQFYAGIVAEPPKNTNKFRYLVFFDDGYAQYVSHKEVLMVYESSKEVWADVHADSADFIRNYVNKYPERPMVRLSIGQVVTTEWNGQWWVARVVELDASLVKMKFENDGRLEWMYRGSTRLSPLYEKQNRQQTRQTARRHVSTVARAKNQPLIEYNYGDEEGKLKANGQKGTGTAKKSTGAAQTTYEKNSSSTGPNHYRMPHYDYGEFEGQIIKKPIPASAPKPKEYVPHKCSVSCSSSFNTSDKDLRKMNPLAIVLHMGWSREIAKNPRRQVFYRSPCGKRLRDLDEIWDFLREAECEISIDYFCLDLGMDCLNEFRHSRQHSYLPDLTYGKELTPVQVVNAFDFEYPPYVEYSADRIPGKGVHLNTNDEFLECCDCTDDCRDKSKCACWQLTMNGISFTKLNENEYKMQGYEYRRLKDHIVSGVYECNSRCSCKKTCFNKVVQNGLKVPLQVFKTAAKGWGIRPLYDVPEGTFICIYAGQVLTEQGANEDGKQFGDEYLAELDFIECNEQIKADYESDVSDIEEDGEGEQSQRKKKRGDGDSDMEVDGHAKDSSYRGKGPTSERTISTRNKNGKGSGSSADSKKSSDEDDDDGTRMRSRFLPELKGLTKTKAKVKERLPLRQYFGKDEQCYIMDAKTVGNIGRYLNHSCQPNVFVQNVFVDTHDLRFPWVAFFSSKHIRAGSELTWDYNYDIGSVSDKVMYCYCASPDCRGRLL